MEDGVNGFVVERPDQLAEAIVAVHEAGESLRESTARWFSDNAATLSADASVSAILRDLEQPS
jgi:hypothetical protein